MAKSITPERMHLIYILIHVNEVHWENEQRLCFFVGLKPFSMKQKILPYSWPLSKVKCVCVAQEVDWVVYLSFTWLVGQSQAICWLRNWTPVAADNYTLISFFHESLFALDGCQWMNERVYKCSLFEKSIRTIRLCVVLQLSFSYFFHTPSHSASVDVTLAAMGYHSPAEW